jgi:Family of unknown function (DUF6226)
VHAPHSRHHPDVIEVEELRAAVDAAFLQTSRGSSPWPDPYPEPDRASVPDEAYSRLTNPAKWRILGARTDAWLMVLVDAGIAVVERDAAVTWTAQPGPVISHAERAVPVAAGALELVVAHSRIGDVDDVGIVLGVGEPAECVNWFPECGCDACDSGSHSELDHLDAHLLGIITGSFRRLSRGKRVITVIGDTGWTASGFPTTARRIGHQLEAILAEPRGWNELSGRSWLDTTEL